MKYLEIRFISDFFGVLSASGVSAKPEHIARHSHGNLQDEVDFLVSKQGYTCLQNTGSSAFLKRGDQQIELICPEKAPEHAAWIASNVQDFAALFETFVTAGSGHFTWLKEHNINRKDLKAMMFQHENGCVIQIVWRNKPVF